MGNAPHLLLHNKMVGIDVLVYMGGHAFMYVLYVFFVHKYSLFLFINMYVMFMWYIARS